MKKLLTELVPGDCIIWPERVNTDNRWGGSTTRNNSGAVVSVELPTDGGCVAKVICTREWFFAGIAAEYDVKDFD